MSKEEQVGLYLSGLVQGVGMRHYVYSQATRLGVKGWVKNLPDGRVQCVAQASPGVLEEFIKCLENARVGRVKQVEKEKVQEPKDYNGFVIEP